MKYKIKSDLWLVYPPKEFGLATYNLKGRIVEAELELVPEPQEISRLGDPDLISEWQKVNKINELIQAVNTLAKNQNLSCCNTPLDEHKRCSECGENC